MFGAFLNPVITAGGAEVQREHAEMSQDVGWSEKMRCGAIAAATTEQCEVAL